MKHFLIRMSILFFGYLLIYLFLQPSKQAFDKRAAELDSKPHIITEYNPEQMLDEPYMPDTWENYYVFSSLPEGYEMGFFATRTFVSSIPLSKKTEYITETHFEKWTDTLHDIESHFVFIQSKSTQYNATQSYVKQVKNPQEKTYYACKEDGNSVVFWFDGEYTFYLKDKIGNLTTQDLENIATKVECHDMPDKIDEDL